MSLRRRLSFALLSCAPALPACDLELSDAGTYGFEAGLENRAEQGSRRVLVGSEFGLKVQRVQGHPAEFGEGALASCVGLDGAGVVSYDGERFRVEAPGEGAVVFDEPSLGCPDLPELEELEGLAELSADQWSLIGVPLEDTTPQWMFGSEAFGLRLHPGPAGEFPPIMGRPLGAVQAVADSPFTLTPILVQTDLEPLTEVRLPTDEALLELAAHDEYLRAQSSGSDPSHHIEGTLAPGDVVNSSLSVFESQLPLPPLESVPLDSVEALELVPVYGIPQEHEGGARAWGPPVGILAIGTDADGERVIALPTRWEVTAGHFFLEPEPPSDFALIYPSCRETVDEPEPRLATIEVRVGALVESLDFEWTALPTDDDGLEAPPCDAPGCACASADPDARPAAVPGLLASLLALWGLLGLRSPRRRPRRDHDKRRSCASTAPR